MATKPHNHILIMSFEAIISDSNKNTLYNLSKK